MGHDLCMCCFSITAAALACLAVSSTYQASVCITQALMNAQHRKPNMTGWATPGHEA